MIAVSQEFKDAIKSRERQIKGYVELINNAKDVELTASTTYDETYTNVSNLVDEEPVKLTYGTLDNLPLDGTQLVMDNSQNDKSPFIISPTAGGNKNITISLERTQVNAITLIPQKIKLKYQARALATNYDLYTAYIIINDGETEVYNQSIDYTNEEINVNFNGATYIDEIIITITPSYDALFWNDTYFAKINQIVLGDTKILKDDDLVEFTTNEEVNKLVEEVPVNETTITVPKPSENSYLSNAFLQNMNEKAKIIPYLGVVTQYGPEYVKMGEFYFDNLKVNKDRTVTINGSNIIKQLQEQVLINDNETNFLSPSSINKQTFETWLSNYPYVINTIDWEHDINTWGIKNLEFVKFLSEIAFANWDVFYADRNSDLNIKHISPTPIDTLTRTEVFDDVILDKISKINTIDLIRIYESQNQTDDSYEVYRGEFTLNKQYQYFTIVSNGANLLNATFSVSGTYNPDIAVITKGYYVAFVLVVGTIGDNITITASSLYRSENSNQIYTISNRTETEKEVKLTFESFANMLPKYYMENSPILDMTPSYETEFEYNGDPSLEAGDYINVELEDGTLAQIFIEKNHFRFYGGLEGHIKGVE